MSTSESKFSSEKPLPGLEPFVDEFYEKRVAELVKLREFLKSEDFESLRTKAHNWKGFCGPYGFLGLGKLAELLEIRSSDKNLKACSQILGDISIYLFEKKAFMDSQKNG